MLRQSFVEKDDTYDSLYQASEQDSDKFGSALRESQKVSGDSYRSGRCTSYK